MLIQVNSLPLGGDDSYTIGQGQTPYTYPTTIVPAGDWITPQPVLPWDAQPYEPWVVPTTPWIVPSYPAWPGTTSAGSITVTTTPITPWRVKYDGDKVMMAIDLPGVKSKDIVLDIKDGIVLLMATRADTNECTSEQYDLGEEYNPNSAEAKLADGVLTLWVKEYPDRVTENVRVPIA